MKFTQEYFDRINSFDTIRAGWEAIAAETGYNVQTICNYYYKFKKEHNANYSYREEKMLKKYKDIVLEISKHPDNIREALRIMSKKYNTSFKSMECCYYLRIKNNPSYPIFNIVSKKSGHMNVKNNINNKYPRYKTNHSFVEQIWGKIKFFLSNIIKK